MVETVIELDPETIAAIERAASLLSVRTSNDRQPEEFTVREFADHNKISIRQSERLLSEATKNGMMTMRRSNINGHYTKLYRTNG